MEEGYYNKKRTAVSAAVLFKHKLKTSLRITLMVRYYRNIKA